MDVTKPHEFIRFGAMDVTKPQKFIGFGAIDVTKPYKFIGFGASDVTKPYKFIGFGAIDVTKPSKEARSAPARLLARTSKASAPKAQPSVVSRCGWVLRMRTEVS